jgi:hypothetical protein
LKKTELQNPNLSEKLPVAIIGQLETLYPKLAPVANASPEDSLSAFGAPTLEMPTIDILSARVAECAFEGFSEPADFSKNARAKEFVSWSAPRNDAYRVYFDARGGKVYVDLNEKRWNETRSKLEEEILYCEILRTLIFVLTCEVELAEAREAEKNADTVTAEIAEVVIP